MTLKDDKEIKQLLKEILNVLIHPIIKFETNKDQPKITQLQLEIISYKTKISELSLEVAKLEAEKSRLQWDNTNIKDILKVREKEPLVKTKSAPLIAGNIKRKRGRPRKDS
jgi:regulator of replication initiation timing